MFSLLPALLLIGGSAALAAGPGPADGGNQGPALTRGTHRMSLDLGNNGVMRYAVSAPKLREGDAVPLVIALHYGGPATPYIGEQYMNLLVKPAFRRLEAVIVAPDCPGNGWTDPLSERAVLALLDHALGSWPVDPDRVVLTGYSMGGIGTWYLAGRHPERFCAIVPVASRPQGEIRPEVPAYVIHGIADEVIDIEPARKAAEEIRSRGGNAVFVEVKRLTHYQTGEYARPLSGAVGWLREIWRDRAGRTAGEASGRGAEDR